MFWEERRRYLFLHGQAFVLFGERDMSPSCCLGREILLCEERIFVLCVERKNVFLRMSSCAATPSCCLVNETRRWSPLHPTLSPWSRWSRSTGSTTAWCATDADYEFSRTSESCWAAAGQASSGDGVPRAVWHIFVAAPGASSQLISYSVRAPRRSLWHCLSIPLPV